MENTAKNFALQLGSLISLYVSIGALITLLFGIITTQYPDPARLPWEYESATASIRYAIAILVIFFPTYLFLTRLVNNIRRHEHGVYLTLTKWLIYLSLLVAGAVILGDLVAVIYSFLNGELTVRFVLKALSMFVVIGSAFAYYVLDAKEYWQKHEKNSLIYGAGTLVVVIVAILMGFMRIETPSEVREIAIDQNQINDLQNIQYQIEAFAQVENRLPESLEETYGELPVPQMDERPDYTYARTSASTFELCAEFAFDSRNGMYSEKSIAPIAEPWMIRNAYTWDYKAGNWCFERAVNTPTVAE